MYEIWADFLVKLTSIKLLFGRKKFCFFGGGRGGEKLKLTVSEMISVWEKSIYSIMINSVCAMAMMGTEFYFFNREQ